jgi:hypothetical protein
MNTRIASAAALLSLTFGAALSPALAQTYGAPAGYVGGGHIAQGGNGYPDGRPPVQYRVVEPRADDAVVTGSIGRRGLDRSAKDGNAEQNNKRFPNYGNTSGGPAY